MNRLVEEYRGKIPSLADKPEETMEATVRALWSCAGGNPVSAERAMEIDLPVLSEGQDKALEGLLKSRADGVPLAHLTGRQRFMGLEFICNGQALIPRKETEILGNAARSLLTDDILPGNQRPRVLDLCTGSGNLACAIAVLAPSCEVFAADLSPEAIELARENTRQLGCSDRVKIFAGDLFAPFECETFYGFFDLIVCNPPYVASAKVAVMHPELSGHEPKLAFDGGPFGVGVIWRVARDAPRFLKRKGWLAFEVGLGQGLGLGERLSNNGVYAAARGVEDKRGNVRALVLKVSDEVGTEKC
ncbi:MAG TPA: HemK/PrmC family methyltransferase [Verrucomicrobiae bacterium]|nr:HemK/PrmC family methyltransferase [Verrucomicrobiae bacterium]